ncbi:glycosyltransferase family 2 protein [Salinicola halophyticus]|uniref:glycosyltransferase family 2 protein n=1 Tax=Salinicola halophyticus TaxID=1808881 RepID=UPI003F446948
MNVAVCAIARNEKSYLVEWVAHQQELGFDSIYIYDNNSDDGSSELLLSMESTGHLQRIHWQRKEGIPPQREAYNHWLANHGSKYDFVFFCDLDEFLNPQGGDVKVFLREAVSQNSNVGAIAIPWLMFGSSGHEKYTTDLVTSRFTRCKSSLNPEVKSFVKPAFGFNMRTHVCDLLLGDYLDNDFLPVSWSSSSIKMDSPTKGKAILHHYYTKSREEWIERRSRAKADRAAVEYRDLAEFDEFHSLIAENNDLLANRISLLSRVESITTQIESSEPSKVDVQLGRVDKRFLFGRVVLENDNEPITIRLLINGYWEKILTIRCESGVYVFSVRLDWENIKCKHVIVTVVGARKSFSFRKKHFPGTEDTFNFLVNHAPSAEKSIFEYGLRFVARDSSGGKKLPKQTLSFKRFPANSLALNLFIGFRKGLIAADDVVEPLRNVDDKHLNYFHRKCTSEQAFDLAALVARAIETRRSIAL